MQKMIARGRVVPITILQHHGKRISMLDLILLLIILLLESSTSKSLAKPNYFAFTVTIINADRQL